MKVDYEKYEDRIPPRTLEALRKYIEHGVPTGGFLHSVLTDSLFGTVGKADDKNLAALGDIVMFIYNESPGDCWGSKATVTKWIETARRRSDDTLGNGAFFIHEGEQNV